jgi:CRISPR/Cas system-associated endoribonuclease Cas2
MSENVGLYVIAVQCRDVRRRARVRDFLRWQGDSVAKDTWEVAVTPAGIQRIRNVLDQELAEGDEARIYPVCGKCRDRVMLYGVDSLTTLPHAYIF